MRAFIKLASWACLLGGGYLAWQGASDYYDSIRYQDEYQKVESLSHVRPGEPGSPREKGRAPVGGPIAKLTIPRLHKTFFVIEGTDDRDLRRGPGHVEGTALPGWDGNCVIAGHRDTHFRVLKDLRKGDVIIVQEPEGAFTYRVTQTSVIDPADKDCLQPTSKAVLNLITCFPFEFIGNAPRRFVVHADLQKT